MELSAVLLMEDLEDSLLFVSLTQHSPLLSEMIYTDFKQQWDAVFLLANGTINNEALYMMGYQAHHEMSTIGKEFTKNFFSMNGTKLYAYYQACSEGGREGWSQVQRFGDEWDGAIIGAPAFRYGQQQVNHLVQNVVEQTMGYYPSPCEFEAIVNATIAACDPMDGLTDGVVSRTDLCKLNFDLNTTVGIAYYCAASTSMGSGGFADLAKRQMPTSSAPAQNGTVTAQAVAVAAKILDGLKTLDGKRAYLPYQPAASFDDGSTTYDETTGTYTLSVSTLGSEWVTRYLQLLDTNTFETGEFANVTYDTLRDWMVEGWQRYEDVLQTTWPDLTPFQQAGGKVIHYHGESDNSIPTASSVRYFESVREVMFPTLSYNESVAELQKFYRLYLVPGAAHCGPNTAEPNGPFPGTNLAVMIDWVEKGVEPVTLAAGYTAGTTFDGQTAEICAWPLRPMFSGNSSTVPECVYDQASIDSWIYDMDAYNMPLY